MKNHNTGRPSWNTSGTQTADAIQQLRDTGVVSNCMLFIAQIYDVSAVGSAAESRTAG